MCFTWQHGETSSGTRKHLVSSTFVIVSSPFFIKKSREVQKRQQKAPVWFYPLCTLSTVCTRYSPEHLFRSCFLPQLSESAVHWQVSLSPILNTNALPFFFPPEMQTASPTLVPAGFSHHVSAPTQKLFGPIIPGPRGEAGCQHRHSPAQTPSRACRLELAGVPAWSWRVGKTCSGGLNSAFRYEAQNPTSHHEQCDKNQVRCSNSSLTVNVINLTLNSNSQVIDYF